MAVPGSSAAKLSSGIVDVFLHNLRKRDKLFAVSWHFRKIAGLPVVGGLLNAVLSGGDKIPFDEPLADGRATDRRKPGVRFCRDLLGFAHIEQAERLNRAKLSVHMQRPGRHIEGKFFDLWQVKGCARLQARFEIERWMKGHDRAGNAEGVAHHNAA